MRSALVVIGPTAVGKTALALKIAKKLPSHILSADSVQVYKGLDIISGKDKESYESIPVSLLDIVSPTTPFSVSEYISSFTSSFSQIPEDTLPIIVGGTGFYLSALFEGIPTVDIKPNVGVRQELKKLSILKLQERLQITAPEKLNSMNNSDRNNPRRLIRAIEVSEKGDQVLGDKQSVLKDFKVKIIGLTCDKEALNKRIDERVDQRLKLGAVDEAKTLFKDYVNLSPQIKSASGYAQLFGYLHGEYDLDTAVKLWKTAEHQNAKKQMTWFKKMKNVEWIDILNSNFETKLRNTLAEMV